jgi:hypothetical protein
MSDDHDISFGGVMIAVRRRYHNSLYTHLFLWKYIYRIVRTQLRKY